MDIRPWCNSSITVSKTVGGRANRPGRVVGSSTGRAGNVFIVVMINISKLCYREFKTRLKRGTVA